MKKQIFSVIVMAVAGILIIALSESMHLKDIYYTTEHGVRLTKKQYENLTKVWPQEELDCLPIPFIEENKDDDQLRELGSDEVTVVTHTFYDENGEPVTSVHEEVSEEEAKKITKPSKEIIDKVEKELREKKRKK